MRLALILVASCAFAQSGKIPSPVVALRGATTPGQLCIEHTDGTSECVKAAADGWLPLTNNTMDLGATATRFRDGWFARDLSVAGTLGVNNLVISGSCTGPGCSVWTRNSGSGYLYPLTTTDDVRTKSKLQLEDSSTGLLMDAYATVESVAGTRAMIFRDNAGAEMLKLSRLHVGAATNTAVFDLSIEPLTNGTRKLGASTKHWTDGYINDLYTLGIHTSGSYVDMFSDLLPSASVTHSLGSTSRRWLKLWVQDLDCTGSCGTSGWTRDSGSGFLYPTTTTDDVRTKSKLQLEDSSTGLLMDVYAIVGSGAGSRAMVFRDNAGAEMLRLDRLFLGAATNQAIFDMDVIPLTNNTRKLGGSATNWSEGRITDIYTLGLHTSGSYIDVFSTLKPSTDTSFDLGDGTHRWGYGHFAFDVNAGGYLISSYANVTNTINSGHHYPNSNNAFDLGETSTPKRWRKLAVVDIDMSGTCTGSGCGASKWTDGGATTYLTATGDNLCVGCTSASYKLDVTGTGRVTSNFDVGGSLGVTGNLSMGASSLLWSTDATGDIGTGTGSRPANIYAATAIFTMDGGGSSVVRTSLSGSGLIVRNTSGTQKGVFAASSGNITADGFADMTGGFKVGGTAGITYTTSLGCVFTLGILTGNGGGLC